MESLFSYTCAHAHQAHWVIFCLLLLTGLSLPISEDVILLVGGAIANTCIPDHALRLYIWAFLGSYLSAWEAYWIGRILGPRLYQIPLFRRVVTRRRLQVLRNHYARLGIFTFIVGRFCPGGIRNALFMTSGLTKMPFHLFILRDGFACLISSSLIFTIGYQFGQHFDLVLHYFHRYAHFFLVFLSSLAVGGCIYLLYRAKKG